MTEYQPAPEPRHEGRRRSPILAAVLSFFIPGLGQIYAGRVLRGVLISIPQFVLIGMLVWIYFDRGPIYLAGWLGINAFGVAVANVLMLVYRALAVIDAYLLARGTGRAATSSNRAWSTMGAVVLAVLLVLTTGLHGVAAYESYAVHEANQDIFVANCDPNAEIVSRDCQPQTAGPTPTPGATPTAAPTPTLAPGETPGPTLPSLPPTASPEPGATATPVPTPIVQTDAYWAANGRLDILILGGDAGPGRFDYDPNAEVSRQRFDAVHVASVDLLSGRSALTSLPRYLQFPPLPPEVADQWSCRCFRAYDGYLNALFAYYWDNPNLVPGEGSRVSKGLSILEGSVEQLLGIEMDGVVLVDMNGFVDIVDAIGGIVVNVEEPVVDDRYNNERGQREFVNIRAGWQEMDGHTALMYVRSRHQDSDIARLGRQQDFLRAVRRQVSDCLVQIAPRLPDLLRAVGESVSTDIPLDDVPVLLELLSKTGRPRRVELHTDNGFSRNLLQRGQLELYRAAMAAAFTPRPGDDEEEEEADDDPPPRFETC